MIRRFLFWSLTWTSLRAWRVAVRCSIEAQRFKPKLTNEVRVPRVAPFVSGSNARN